ncbi:4-aminobutyrate aminotransferase [Microvirga sp. 3-52]|uniref:4-aminobutyrate aminotransferase n=1 Tax=Microvirga sp. 3-52 TaxID=2792425 RepID=UPI001ACE51CE|nr:4-aminobutyrate aminotransferase [Microvirga sp. 3-52]MBO1909081.1 4-aminobutyrate aminotransferase [Microvirga sp. 3-52]MBS7455331.1 4-aminobutyrate aminotransferase [Microvirga sp. 3-52]
MHRLQPPAAVLVLGCSLVLSGTAALAQTNSGHRSTEVVAGKSHRLGVYGNVQKDCTSGPLPTVRVVTPPKHGELNVRSGTLKAGRIARCPKLAPKAQGVFYKASQTFKGTDEVSYEIKSASGKLENHTVRITVKAATPADTKPTPDADTEL